MISKKMEAYSALSEESAQILLSHTRNISDYLQAFCKPEDITVTIIKQGRSIRIRITDGHNEYENSKTYAKEGSNNVEL